MSEISEFRDEMREILVGMNKRFDSMDKRFDSLEKELIENTKMICDQIHENDEK